MCLTLSLRASGAVHWTISVNTCSVMNSSSRVRRKPETFAVLSSPMSTFLAARFLQRRENNNYMLCSYTLICELCMILTCVPGSVPPSTPFPCRHPWQSPAGPVVRCVLSLGTSSDPATSPVAARLKFK